MSNAVSLPKFYEYLNKYFGTKFRKLLKISTSLENNSWETNKKFELSILGFEPFVAKVWNPSEGLMQSKLKQSICICSICLVFQDYLRYIVHKVCFNLLSHLLYRFSIFHNNLLYLENLKIGLLFPLIFHTYSILWLNLGCLVVPTHNTWRKLSQY